MWSCSEKWRQIWTRPFKKPLNPWYTGFSTNQENSRVSGFITR